MRFLNELSQFLRVILPTLQHNNSSPNSEISFLSYINLHLQAIDHVHVMTNRMNLTSRQIFFRH